jgi:hypothetical protein
LPKEEEKEKPLNQLRTEYLGDYQFVFKQFRNIDYILAQLKQQMAEVNSSHSS